MKKDDAIYVKHIYEAIQKIEKYLRRVAYEKFSKNDLLIDAVVRELTIIGEAAAHISEEFRARHPKVPFYEIIGMRNRIIHEYFNVDLKIVWETCKNDLKKLKKIIKPLVT